MKNRFNILFNPSSEGGGGNPDVLSSPEAKQAIEKARTEERTRLGATIETIRSELEATKVELTTAKTQVADLTSKLKEVTDAFEALKASVKAGSGDVDIPRLIEETAAKTRSVVEAEFNEKLTGLSATVEAEQKKARALEIRDLRNRLIKANGGERAMIVELVKGDDEASILASIETAKQVHAKAIGAAGGKPKPSTAGSEDDDALPPGDESGGEVAPDVRNMTLQDYAKNRDALRRRVSGRYGGGGALR